MERFRTVTGSGVIYDIQRIREHRRTFSKRGVTYHVTTKAHYATTSGLRVARVDDSTFKILTSNILVRTL